MRVRSFWLEPDSVEEFVQIAWKLREGDPRWIPPVRGTLRAHLSEANPFFRYGRIRNFLALRDGRGVGRCSAIIDPRLAAEERPVGMIGHFETELDYATASGLLDASLAWLEGEGVGEVWGPVDFSIFNAYRFKTGGFDREPFWGEPENPPEYPEYFNRYGFEVLEAYTAWDLDEEQVIAVQESTEAAARRKGVADRGYGYRTLDPERLDEELRTLHELAVECFVEHTGYVPISYEEFALWNRSSSLLMDPDIILVFTAPDGEVAGASYKYPDWAPLLRKLDGRVDPDTPGEHLRDVTVDRAVFHTDMVRPPHRRKGVIQGSFARFIAAARARGYTRAVTGLAKAGNPIWGNVLDVAEPSREYALFRIELDRPHR